MMITLGNKQEDWTLGMVQKNLNMLKAKVAVKKPASKASELRNSIASLNQKITAFEQLKKVQERKLKELMSEKL